MSSSDSRAASLHDPIRIGAIEAPNRIFMAPLTRARATHDHVPTPMMAEYYAQRASAGLIVSEATGISREGLGWPYAPGIWTSEQASGWREVTDAVHAAGGRIFAQLWHMGRLVHPDFADGAQPVSASPSMAPGHCYTYDGKRPYASARALEIGEIPTLIDDYRRAAALACEAGFDGVQIHAGNGYLIDQFLRDSTNFRTDAYGGSIENRIRLLFEITEAVAGEVEAGRTAVRLSPNGDSQGANDSAPATIFTAAAAALSTLGMAFLELREPDEDGTFGRADHPPVAPYIRKVFAGPLVLNSDYDLAKARHALSTGAADAISFGRGFLANPDLPARLAIDAALNTSNPATWYSRGREGYLDYPSLAATPLTSASTLEAQ